MDRSYHNLFNQLITGVSGNEMNAFMDRFAKTDRQKHRDVGGHDVLALVQMLFKYRDKFTPTEIVKTWAVHRLVDGMDSSFKAAVRQTNPTYGKKSTTNEKLMKSIDALKKELLRL